MCVLFARIASTSLACTGQWEVLFWFYVFLDFTAFFLYVRGAVFTVTVFLVNFIMRICFILGILGYAVASTESSNCSEATAFEPRMYYVPLRDTLMNLQRVLRKSSITLRSNYESWLDNLINELGSRIMKRGPGDLEGLLKYIAPWQNSIIHFKNESQKPKMFGLFGIGREKALKIISAAEDLLRTLKRDIFFWISLYEFLAKSDLVNPTKEIWWTWWEEFRNHAKTFSLHSETSECLRISPTSALEERKYLFAIWLYIEEYRLSTNLLESLSLDDTNHEKDLNAKFECDMSLDNFTIKFRIHLPEIIEKAKAAPSTSEFTNTKDAMISDNEMSPIHAVLSS